MSNSVGIISIWNFQIIKKCGKIPKIQIPQILVKIEIFCLKSLVKTMGKKLTFVLNYFQERIGNFSKLMTLDKRAWCAPISLRLSKEPIDSSSEASNLMKLVKSSPVDKGTTTSYYCLKSGQLKTRVIETAQDKSFHLKRVETTEEHSYFGLDKESKDLRNLIKKRLFEESFSENLLKLQVIHWFLKHKKCMVIVAKKFGRFEFPAFFHFQVEIQKVRKVQVEIPLSKSAGK